MFTYAEEILLFDPYMQKKILVTRKESNTHDGIFLYTFIYLYFMIIYVYICRGRCP